MRKTLKKRLWLLLFFLTPGCEATNEFHIGQVKEIVDDSILILPGAEDIRRSEEYSGVITFKVNDGYPAVYSLHTLHERLARAGWQPTESDIFNPGRGTDMRRWGVAIIDGQRISNWSGQWVNRQGDILAFALTYRGSSGGNDITPTGPVEIRILKVSAETVEELKAILK